jgi:hypothetical protein
MGGPSGLFRGTSQQKLSIVELRYRGLFTFYLWEEQDMSKQTLGKAKLLVGLGLFSIALSALGIVFMWNDNDNLQRLQGLMFALGMSFFTSQFLLKKQDIKTALMWLGAIFVVVSAILTFYNLANR